MLCSIEADGLRDSQDVIFIESEVEGGAAMARSAKRHAPAGDGGIGRGGVVGRDEPRHVDQ